MAKPFLVSYRLIAVLVILGLIIGVFTGYVTPITGFATGTTTITIATATGITLQNSTIAMGTLSQGATNDTTDDSPGPFVVQNDGNIHINATIKATDLFNNSNPVPTMFFQYKCGNYTSERQYNCTNAWSRTAWNDTPRYTGSGAMVIANLSWEDPGDQAEIDINVTAPSNESGGAKSATVVVDAVACSPNSGCS
jgi:hypothetical protein